MLNIFERCFDVTPEILWKDGFVIKSVWNQTLDLFLDGSVEIF